MFETRIKVDMKDLEELTKKYPEVSKNVRISKLLEAVNLLEAEIKKRTHYGAGPIHLRDGIFSKVNTSGKKVAGLVGVSIEHGEPVEKGTKPHFPPTGPIQFWVERKLNITGKEAASVAFLIARAISRRGTKGEEMFEKGFEASEARVMRILEEISEEIVRRVS